MHCANGVDCVRVVILLVDHLDLWPAGLLHAIVRTSEACCTCKLRHDNIVENLLPSSRRSALPDFLPTIAWSLSVAGFC